MLPSLYDFRPESYGLPPFADTLAHGVVPVEPPWRLKVRSACRRHCSLGCSVCSLGYPLREVLPEDVHAHVRLQFLFRYRSRVSLQPKAHAGHMTELCSFPEIFRV